MMAMLTHLNPEWSYGLLVWQVGFLTCGEWGTSHVFQVRASWRLKCCAGWESGSADMESRGMVRHVYS